jgi:uncharacterized membrane protein
MNVPWPGHPPTVTHPHTSGDPRSDAHDGQDETRSTVVLGVDVASAPFGPVGEFLDEFGRRLAAAHPVVDWDVRQTRGRQPEDSSEAPVPVSTLLARGRRALLADDLDVVLVVTDAPVELRGRRVAGHVSPVQQAIVLSVRDTEPGTLVDEAAALVSSLLELDDLPADEHEVLHQLASSVPGEVAGSAFVARALRGNLRLLLTMIRANRPWLLTLHLSRTLVGAFAAAFVAVVTPDFWMLADRMSTLRLVLITVLVLGATCVVLVVGGGLRERPPSRRARRTVLLHNTAVWTSVGIGVVTLFAGLVCANLAVTLAVLPWGLVAQTVGHPVGLGTMLQVGALTGVVALVGSAFGAGLEDDEDVHAATYTGSDDARYADVDR